MFTLYSQQAATVILREQAGREGETAWQKLDKESVLLFCLELAPKCLTK